VHYFDENYVGIVFLLSVLMLLESIGCTEY